MPVFNVIPGDLGAVFAFQELGCSVIPLIGGADIQSGKRPALPWSVYQQRLPALSELHKWFTDLARLAYGVVCGQLSRLIVLDLDDASLALRFMQHFPHLLNTLIVQSGVRSTPHIYWRVDFPVRSRTFAGGDLKGDGGYVVGPGSQIGAYTWEIVNHAPVRDLSAAEFEAVRAFLKIAEPATVSVPALSAAEAVDETHFVNLYRHLCQQYQSRNQALFRSACLLRDRGMSRAMVVDLLGPVHAAQASLSDQRQESYAWRYGEALRTIASVFLRPARLRSVTTATDGPVSRLANSVREALLAQPDGIAAARLLEAAYIVGFAANRIFTETEICTALKGIMCRETIRKALTIQVADRSLFAFTPPDNPPAVADTVVGETRQKNAFLSGGQKQTRRFFRLPDVRALCALLQVEVTSGDALNLADVSDARTYRQALHRALIERRPGRYSQKLLAGRVNVSARTIRRYNQQLGVQAQPSYQEMPVSWSTLSQLPTAADIQRHSLRTGGRFLLDDSGKRWPLKREIAEYLLKQKRRVSQIHQGVNYYWCGTLADEQPAEKPHTMPVMGQMLSVGIPTLTPQLPDVQNLPLKFPVEYPENAPEAPCMRSKVDSRGDDQKRGEKRHSKRYFRTALPDVQDEQLAQRVAQVTGNMSLCNARRLVTTFGYQPVAATVGKLAWLKREQRVINPAGFMVTVARVSWRKQHGAETLDKPAPRFTAEPRRDRLAVYVPPQADPVWQSPAYQEWRAEFFGLDDNLPLVIEGELPY